MATTHPVEIMGNISHRNELLDTNTGKKKSKKSKKKKGSGENNNFTSTTIKIIKSLGPIIKKVGKALEDIGTGDDFPIESNSENGSILIMGIILF